MRPHWYAALRPGIVSNVKTNTDRTARGSLRVWLELDEDDGALHGSMTTDDEYVEEFHGWLGLAGVLQRMLAANHDEGRR